ncbi:TRUD [Hepatospora eriocheir]|uniref:TRUD n=1 Tax=Hepatospora eriocheir TaxID=1081669 RepID=A0A1X0QKT3_9MICR|nr:TRUD [Hepatospora eriocheir]
MSDLHINKYLSNKNELNSNVKIKSRCEDFIVKEVRGDNSICEYKEIIDFDKFILSKEYYDNFDFNKTYNKEERKEFYGKIKYFPLYTFKVDEDRLIQTDEEDYFEFTLIKCNLNTSDAVSILSRGIGCSFNYISFSGNKDKKAITYQDFSVKTSFKKIFSYILYLNETSSLKNQHFKSKNDLIIKSILCDESIKDYINKNINVDFDRTEKIMISDLRRGRNIQMGSHLGNHFIIKLQNITNLNRATNFLNYFGYQRFGKHLNNHLIGEALLNQNYEEAIKLIKSDENDDSKVIRFINNNISKRPKEIFRRMDRNHKMIYFHAYQSYLFNKEISELEIKEEDFNRELNLKKFNSKFLKGGKRQIIEKISNLKINETENTVEFTLNKSCYATIALREIVQNEIYE